MKGTSQRFLRSVTAAAALTSYFAGPLRTAFGAQSSAENLTTIYVNKYFEVREHEAPTKYVFKGNTRVARVTGSLTTNARVQRLRVYPGWNLCSLAVTATNTLYQFSQANAPRGVEALYRWVTQDSNYAAVLPGETLPAGTVFWLKASTNLNLSVVGAYSNPNSVRLAPGPNFIASAGLEAWTLTNALPPTVSAWKHSADTGAWSIEFADPLQSRSDLSGFIAPSEAVFIQAGAPALFAIPDGNLRTSYYHQDHLRSSSATTDGVGNLVEEDTFYPFGHQRRTFQPRNVREPYTFTCLRSLRVCHGIC